MLLVLALALQPSVSTSAFYAWTIVGGPLFSLAGTVLLDAALGTASRRPALRASRRAPLYIAALRLGCAGFGSAPRAPPPFVLGSAALYPPPRPNLGRLEIPVLLTRRSSP